MHAHEIGTRPSFLLLPGLGKRLVLHTIVGHLYLCMVGVIRTAKVRMYRASNSADSRDLTLDIVLYRYPAILTRAHLIKQTVCVN